MERLEPLPYYKWFWKDWRANRRVQRMSWQARGIYRELLDECWAEGSISTDPKTLAEIVGCTVDDMERYLPEILPCLIEESGLYLNGKIESMRTEDDALRARRRRAGKSGGLAKSNGNNAKLASASKCQEDASKCHIEEKRREEKSKEEKTLAQRFALSDCVPIYEAYPRKVGRGAALKAILKAINNIEDPDPVNNLLRIVQNYARSPAGNRGEYTPHPATWFNRKSYLDDPTEWEKVR